MGGEELVETVIENILDNAVGFSPPGSTITLSAERRPDAVVFSVADHGPGIPEADRKHAVERFVRLEASRTLPGSGLGLSLASAVATLHGGELRLSDAGPGLCATLAFPARTGDAQAAPTQTAEQIPA